MIEYIKGDIMRIEKNKVIVNNNGIGYIINIAEKISKTLKLNEQIELIIYDLIKEADRKLFGFLNMLDRTVFEFLLLIDGIGPSSAMRIMDNLNSSDILISISKNETDPFMKIHGIGKKSIDKITKLSKKATAIINNCELN